MILAGDLSVFHEPDDYTATGAKVFDVTRLVFACVDLGGDDVARSALAQHKTLDAPLDGFVFDVLFDGQPVLGGYHALVEAELLPRVVVVAETREQDIQHGPHFVDLVALVDVRVLLVDQVEEGPQRQEAVTFHHVSEARGERHEVVRFALPVVLVPRLDDRLLHHEPEPHESLHLWHAGGLVALGVITIWVQSFDLRCIEVGFGAQ